MIQRQSFFPNKKNSEDFEPYVARLSGSFVNENTGAEVDFTEVDHYAADKTVGVDEYWEIQGDDGAIYYILEDSTVVDDLDNVVGHFDPYSDPDPDRAYDMERELDFYESANWEPDGSELERPQEMPEDARCPQCGSDRIQPTGSWEHSPWKCGQCGWNGYVDELGENVIHENAGGQTHWNQGREWEGSVKDAAGVVDELKGELGRGYTIRGNTAGVGSGVAQGVVVRPDRQSQEEILALVDSLPGHEEDVKRQRELIPDWALNRGGKVGAEFEVGPGGQGVTYAPGVIVVAKWVTPDDNFIIQHDKCVGIVAEAGGRTSHGVLIARERNIPIVVDAKDAAMINPGDEVVVNAGSGIVDVNGGDETFDRGGPAQEAAMGVHRFVWSNGQFETAPIPQDDPESGKLHNEMMAEMMEQGRLDPMSMAMGTVFSDGTAQKMSMGVENQDELDEFLRSEFGVTEINEVNDMSMLAAKKDDPLVCPECGSHTLRAISEKDGKATVECYTCGNEFKREVVKNPESKVGVGPYEPEKKAPGQFTFEHLEGVLCPQCYQTNTLKIRGGNSTETPDIECLNCGYYESYKNFLVDTNQAPREFVTKVSVTVQEMSDVIASGDRQQFEALLQRAMAESSDPETVRKLMEGFWNIDQQIMKQPVRPEDSTTAAFLDTQPIEPRGSFMTVDTDLIERVESSMQKEAPGKKHLPYATPKRNRQYEHILENCKKEHPDYTLDRCKELAAATTNKTRAEKGETKNSATPFEDKLEYPRDEFYKGKGGSPGATLYKQLRLQGVSPNDALQHIAQEYFNGDLEAARNDVAQNVQLTGAHEESELQLARELAEEAASKMTSGEREGPYMEAYREYGRLTGLGEESEEAQAIIWNALVDLGVFQPRWEDRPWGELDGARLLDQLDEPTGELWPDTLPWGEEEQQYYRSGKVAQSYDVGDVVDLGQGRTGIIRACTGEQGVQSLPTYTIELEDGRVVEGVFEHAIRGHAKTSSSLEAGQWYVMRSPKYKVPDVIQVLNIEDGHVEAAIEGDDKGMWPVRLTDEEIEEMRYTFEPYTAKISFEDYEDRPEEYHRDLEWDCPECGSEYSEIVQEDEDGGVGLHCTDCGAEWYDSPPEKPEYEPGGLLGQEPSRQGGWKLARRNFSVAEQNAFIGESEGSTARNIDKLDLDGTHYTWSPKSGDALDEYFLW